MFPTNIFPLKKETDVCICFMSRKILLLSALSESSSRHIQSRDEFRSTFDLILEISSPTVFFFFFWQTACSYFSNLFQLYPHNKLWIRLEKVQKYENDFINSHAVIIACWNRLGSIHVYISIQTKKIRQNCKFVNSSCLSVFKGEFD